MSTQTVPMDLTPLADEMDRDYLDFLQREQRDQRDPGYGYNFDDRMDDL